MPRENFRNLIKAARQIRSRELDVSFQQVVHPVLTEEAEVAETSDSKGEPDERAQECPSNATRSRANCTAGGEWGNPKTVGVCPRTDCKWVSRYRAAGFGRIARSQFVSNER